MISESPSSEAVRLEALYDFQILDTPAEEVFDAFTRLAASLCAVPIAMMSMIDEDRLWLKSTVGLEGVRELPREGSFCDATLRENDLFEVRDAKTEQAFKSYPLVRRDWGIRFYAAVPLKTRTGYVIGTLAVMDVRPRSLTEEQCGTLRTLAAAVMDQLDARRTLMRLVDASRSELYHFDIATQRIVFASEGALRNLGYSAKEIRSLSVEALLPDLREPFSTERLMQGIASRDGEPMIVYTTARRKDGSTYPIELRIELVRSYSRPLLYAFGLDITERRASEDRIRLLSTAVEHAGDAIAIYRPAEPVDAKTPSTIVYANDAFLHSVGYTRDEVIGKTTALFVGKGDDRPMIEDARARVLQGETVRIRSRTYRKDGTTFWTEQSLRPLIDPAGRVTHILAVRRDVTSEVMHEAALATQNDILTDLTSVARELFAALDPHVLVDR
ncbi:MAG: PAS domain S-box protein, partial [Candidatus Eremiobacteraeota bacterium]|nr:PAS domain S-box protein [Candidatus Eremiobacteraeota bacterium]